jgi:UDP-3-O-[3-hydroxymyristoyl] glucosamine N-acyltransferase
MELTLRELAELLDASLELRKGSETQPIRGINAMRAADATEVTFVVSGRHLAAALNGDAGAVIVKESVAKTDKPLLLVDNVDAAMIKVLEHFAPKLIPPRPGIHPSTVMGENVRLGRDVTIGAFVSLADNVSIGDGTVLGAGCRVEQGSKIGSHCVLDANVVVYHNCTIGNQVRILANSTIGAMGFGYAYLDGAHRLVPHNGGVIIEDFVDIGANCCIDRAKFTNTIVGAGTKMDNMVQIGHSVVLGKCCLLSAQTGVAGSTTIGDGSVLAGQSGVADNLTLADRTVVGAKAGVMKSVQTPGQTLHWTPALEQKEALRVFSDLYRLPKTVKRIRELEERVDRLDAAKNDQG